MPLLEALNFLDGVPLGGFDLVGDGVLVLGGFALVGGARVAAALVGLLGGV